jgi:adenylate kinase
MNRRYSEERMTPADCILIILGPPGAGKGTQAKGISEELGIPHIDCGQTIRDEVSEKSEFGLKAKEIVSTGGLVPDELIIGVILKRISKSDCEEGFLLDGFPRTLEQARGLDAFLVARGTGLDYILSLVVDEDIAVRRLSARRYCPACGSIFNISTAPSKVEGVCDKCGGEIVQRPDDKPETIIERFWVYAEETAPLIEYYKAESGYREFDGGRDTGFVFNEIISVIREEGSCSEV